MTNKIAGHGRVVCELHGTLYLSCRCIHGAHNVRKVSCKGWPDCRGALKPPEQGDPYQITP